jgi:hypothetical protein
VPEEQRDLEGQAKDTLSRLFRAWHKPIQALIGSTEGGRFCGVTSTNRNVCGALLGVRSDCSAMPPTG